MSQYHWDKLARALIPPHTREIARTIFAAHAKPVRVSFFLEQSEAMATLDRCVEVDVEAVWEELASYLTDDARSGHFVFV